MLSVIRKMEAVLPCPLSANRASKQGECAIYDFYTTWYDGVKRQNRLKVQIFAETMARGLEIESSLDRALVTFGDCGLSETVKSCTRSGGGWLMDGDMHVRIAYYDLILKEATTNGN